MSGTPSWDKITGPLGSTTTAFGGNWANLISDYYNGVNISLIDATKAPLIGTLTRYVFEKLSLLDTDSSHSVILSVDDIDTGPTRKIRIRRMNTPYEEDFAVLERLPQQIYSKTIDASLNTVTNLPATSIAANAVTTAKILDANVTLAKLASNSVDSSKIVDDSIVNADVNSSAGIITTKLADSTNFVLTTRTNSFGDFNQVFKDNRLLINNPADTFAYTIIGAAIAANRNLTLPLLTGNDVVVAEAFSQTLTNKIINADSNTITNIDDNEIKAAAGIVTTKLADSANFILKTLDNSFGAHYHDITKMTAPSNPSANDIRVYVDTADTHLKIRNNAGTVVDLHSGGGGGATNLDALTDVDLTAPTPTNGDVLTYTTTGTKWIPAAPPGAGGSITASSVTTFTNKTIDADGTGNSISNIENADIKSAAAIATTKLADSANFILKTLDNSFGAHYQDFTKMTAPSNPGANDIRMYVDTADTHMKIKNNAGTVVDLHTGGGGGGTGTLKSGSATKSGNATAPTTVFTIAHSFGSTPATAIVLPSSTDAIGSYITDVDGTNITITYASPPPTGTNNLEYFWLVSEATITGGGGGGGSPTGAAGGDLTGTYPNPTITAAAVCTTKLGDDCVTFQKLQNLTDQRLIGRSAGSAGDPQEIAMSGNDFTFDTTSATIGVNNYDVFKRKIEYFEDCMSGVATGTSGTGFVAQESSGTGSTVSNVAVSETGVFGVFDCQTGTTATGFASLYSGQTGRPAFLLGQGVTIMEAKVKIPTLSTSSERFKIVIGFAGDTDTPTINDGVYFEYIDNLSSGAWRYCTSNDGTRTEVASAVTASTTVWRVFKIVINAAASSVDFLIDGSVVGTTTTNIPSGTGDPVGVIAGIFKTVGTTTRSLYVDYIAMSLRLTTARA